MSQGSLAGRTVLELGSFLAAPFAANILNELGADIIKVEPLRGDPTRGMGKGGNPSGTFIAYSRGKRSICLDLRAAAGHEVFERLLQQADVIIHNLAPDSARHLHVTYDDCRRINPNIVYCHIKGYGPGPLENEIASNPVAEAATGVMHAHRINNRPTRLGPSYHDQFAGMYSVIGILAALAAKHSSPSTHHIEIGLYETGLHVAARELVNRQLAKIVPATPGEAESGEFSFAGYGAYEASDGRWIYLVMLTDLHWRKFCEVMGIPDGSDPELATSRQRKTQRQRVETLVTQAVRALPYEDIAARLQSVSFGYTEVKPAAEVLNDPQARQPGKLVEVQALEHRFTVPNVPIMSAVVRKDMNGPPPKLGQHTREILDSLGYSEAECNTLIASQAAGAPTV